MLMIHQNDHLVAPVILPPHNYAWFGAFCPTYPRISEYVILPSNAKNINKGYITILIKHKIKGTFHGQIQPYNLYQWLILS